SAWNGTIHVHGDMAHVEGEAWNSTLAPGASTTFGFCASGCGGPPTCTLPPPDDEQPSAEDPPPPPPPDHEDPPAEDPPAGVSPAATRPAEDPPAPPVDHGQAGFWPYVDATLWPPFALVAGRAQSGVRGYSLGFVVSNTSRACTAAWGGFDVYTI